MLFLFPAVLLLQPHCRAWYNDAGAAADMDNRIAHIVNHKNPNFGNRAWKNIPEAILGFDIQNEGQAHMPNDEIPNPNWICDRATNLKQLQLDANILVLTGGGADVSDSTIPQVCVGHYAYMHAYICAHLCACMHMHIYMNVHTRTHTHAHTRARTYVHHAHIHQCTHACMRTSVHALSMLEAWPRLTHHSMRATLRARLHIDLRTHHPLSELHVCLLLC